MGCKILWHLSFLKGLQLSKNWFLAQEVQPVCSDVSVHLNMEAEISCKMLVQIQLHSVKIPKTII
jgi:hypothetical protein